MTGTVETSRWGERQQGGLLVSIFFLPRGRRHRPRAMPSHRGQDAARKVGDKLSGVTGSLNETAEGGGFKA